MAEKEIKLEESFDKLNQIMEALEKPDISLEDSFTLYQEGMKLLKGILLEKNENDILIELGNKKVNVELKNISKINKAVELF